MSSFLTPETRWPRRALGPALRPEGQDLQHPPPPPPAPRGRKLGARPRGEGPPGARASPRGQSPPPAPGLCAGCPRAASPRRPAPGQSSRPHPGPTPRQATFSVSPPLWGQGCAAPSGGRPRGAYLGAGAADPARAQPPPPAAAGLGRRAQPRRLCSLRGSLRSRPGVTFSLAPNPPPTHPSRPGPRFARPLAARRAGASPPPPSPRLLPSSRPPPPPPPLRAALPLPSRRSHLLSSLLSLQRPSLTAGEKISPPPQSVARAPSRPSPDAKGSDPAPNYPARRARAGARGDSWLGARLRRGAED